MMFKPKFLSGKNLRLRNENKTYGLVAQKLLSLFFFFSSVFTSLTTAPSAPHLYADGSESLAILPLMSCLVELIIGNLDTNVALVSMGFLTSSFLTDIDTFTSSVYDLQ